MPIERPFHQSAKVSHLLAVHQASTSPVTTDAATAIQKSSRFANRTNVDRDASWRVRRKASEAEPPTMPKPINATTRNAATWSTARRSRTLRYPMLLNHHQFIQN